MHKKGSIVLVALVIGALMGAGISYYTATQAMNVGAPSQTTTRNLQPFADSTYEIGTTSTAYLRGTFDELCLTADTCETTWTGGGGGSTLHVDGGGFVYPQTGDYHSAPFYEATSTATSSLFSGGFRSTASSTFTDTLHANGELHFQDLFNFDAQLKSGLNRLILKSDAGNADAELFLAPTGSNVGAATTWADSPNTNNFGGLRIGTNGTVNFIRSTSSGSGTTLPLEIQSNGNIAMTFNTDDTIDFDQLTTNGLLQVSGGDGSLSASTSIGSNVIADEYLFNSGDTITGNLTFSGASIVIGGDTINEFAGTGLTVSGNSLTADLGTAVDLQSEVTDNFTDGSVLFWGTTAVSEDNANLFWDNTDNELGIGETTPLAPLHITNDQAALTELRIDNSNVSGSMALTLFDGSNQRAEVHYDTASALLNIGTHFSSGQLTFSTNADAEAARFDASGNLGLGEATPNARLTVGSSTSDKLTSGELYRSTYVSGELEVDGSVWLDGNVNITEGALSDDSILEADLKAVDAPGDEECLTYETTTGDFEWQTCGGGEWTDNGAELVPSENEGIKVDYVTATSTATNSSFAIDIQPDANDGAALGTSGTAWSDVFLASGGQLNFNASDVTLTHSANQLDFTGAANGYKFDASIQPNNDNGASLGTSGINWSDLFLNTGGVINWEGGDITLTHSTNLLTFAGGGFDAGGATSFEIPNGTNPTVDAAGEMAFDTTQAQFIGHNGSSVDVFMVSQDRSLGSIGSTSQDRSLNSFDTGTSTWSGGHVSATTTVTSLFGYTDTGTCNVQVGDGTSSSTSVVADSDGQRLSVSETFIPDEEILIGIGGCTSSPNWTTPTITQHEVRQ